MKIYHHAYIYIIYNYTTCNSIISTITQISSLELNTISSPMAHTHNYIPYNYDIILVQEVHALTYPFPHKSSHSFHQFQAPNTWTFLYHFTQTRDCFYSPKIEQVSCPRAAHSSYIGSSWWNRIPYPFPVLYTPNHNLFNKLSHMKP